MAVPANYIIADTYTNTTSNSVDVVYEVRGTSGAGCVGDSEFITITINPEPVVNPALDATVCSREVSGITFSTNGTSVAASSYNLISVTPDPSLTPDPGNVGAAPGVSASYIVNDRFTNITSGNLTVSYVVEPVSPQGCVGDQETIILTVRPEPILDPGLSPAPICSDVASGVVLSVAGGSVGASTYNLVGIAFDPGLIPSGSNAALGTGYNANVLSADTYTNTTNNPLTATYSIVPVSIDGCEGQSQVVIFTVNPAPALSTNLDRLVCDSEPSGIVLATTAASFPAANYEIVSANIEAGLNPVSHNTTFPRTTADVNELANESFENPDDVVKTVEYRVVPISGPGCRGPEESIILSIEPRVKATVTNTTPDICSNTMTNITLTSPTMPSAGTISFTVTASDNGGAGEVFGYSPFLTFLPDGHVITDNLINLSNTTKTVTYEVTANAAGAKNGLGCNSVIEVVTVDVQPTPVLTVSELFQTICSGETTDIDLTTPTVFSGGKQVVFELTSITPQPGVSGYSSIGTIYNSVDKLEETLINVNDPNSFTPPVVYQLTPRSDDGLCIGTPVNISISVNPTPSAVFTGDATICSGGFATIQFQFAGRLPFSIVYNDGTSDITLDNLGPVHFITDQYTETTTFTLISVEDANGCQATGLGDQVTITVEDAVADPTIEGDSEGCSPLTVTFRNNDVRAGVTYEWNWGDGTPSTITSDATVTHEFNNASTFTSLTYNVTLFATNDAQGCQDSESLVVEVQPTILPNILPSTLEGCAPLTVSFLNNTLGAAEHEWFYREKGTTQMLEVGTTPLITYELPNETANTIVYEVVYTASKGACSEQVITDITVYPELAPSFTISENPIEVSEDDGTATITVTNTTPNKNAWTYEWNWGDGETTTAVDPGSHTYQQYGEYEITVRILFDGGICEATTSEVLIVEPIFPDVNFEADILEGCQPLTVNFTNLSVATDPNSYSWEIINVQTGNVVGTSNQENFTFPFNQDGTYTVTLSGSNPLGIVDTETKDNYIKVNENPVASFSVRPSIVYLPDGVVFTQNLSSRADKFFWDFNANDPNDAGQANGEEDLVSELFEPEVVYNYRGFKDIMLVAEFTETGCTDTLIVEQAVFVDQGGETRVPNAFSPNPDGPTGGTGGSGGDGGFNDNFLPFVQGVAPEPGSFHMQIFDRWGNLVFESWDQNVGWDGYDKNGKLMPMGVYVYRLDLKFVDGNTSIRIGDVTLVR